MKIRRRKNRGGSRSWQLDCGMIDGRRVQLSFATENEAEAERERRERLLRKHGEAAFTITEAERIRFAAARDRLAAAEATIEQAVDFYLAARPSLRPAVPLRDLYEICRAEKVRLKMRKTSLKQFGVSCRSFMSGREEQFPTLVTRDDVKEWILGNGFAPKTQRVYLGDVHALFSWAQKERYVAVNPCKEIPLSKMDDKEIQIFGAEECERLLMTAATYWGPTWHPKERRWRPAYRFLSLLGYATLATFCGIRPEELKRTTRAELDLADGSLLVMGGRAKTRQRRIVDLPAAAIGWLELWVAACPGNWIIPPNFDRLWSSLREEAKLCPWPHDVLRHTCASMHLVFHKSEAAVKSLLGHSKDEDTLFRSYRAVRLPSGRPISRAEAERFYGIVRPGLIVV